MTSFDNDFNRKGLIDHVKDQFRIDLRGHHGIDHWARVKNIGQKLCEQVPEADPFVVEVFAWTHDLARVTESHDLEHGPDGCYIVAQELRNFYFEMTDEQWTHLMEAIRWHSHGRTEAHPTVQVCWDSDRLDLGRVGIIPDPQYLCTDAAKDPAMIRWAYEQSLKKYTPRGY